MTTQHPLAAELAPRIDGSLLKGRQGRRYHADPGLLAAVNVALTLERPLLLTGEPGCGKTDFAWAASGALAAAQGLDVDLQAIEKSPVAGDGEADLAFAGVEPLQCYVRSDTRARDLLYLYDAVRRFGDAHHGGEDGAARAADPRRYIELQPLGRALVSSRRRVVLIDEIDKAPRDLPNDLLRELDQASFEIPEIPEATPGQGEVRSHGAPLRRVMRRGAGAAGSPTRASLVIITSNVERQLPDAFLRRCIFWHIEFPKQLLPEILEEHCPQAEGDLRGRTIAIFSRVREIPGLVRRPGTAELIDWVNALTRVYERAHATKQVRRLSDLLAQGDAPVPWRELPGLGCLVKLREDQNALARG
jgi:MoxR-like ATPase